MADDMRRIVLKIIKDVPSQKTPGSGKQLAIVQWAKADKSIAVQLIQSDYWINENDKQVYHKAKGVPFDGLMALFAPGPNKEPSLWAREKLSELFKNPPPVKAAPQAAPAPDSNIEEVPF